MVYLLGTLFLLFYGLFGYNQTLIDAFLHIFIYKLDCQ